MSFVKHSVPVVFLAVIIVVLALLASDDAFLQVDLTASESNFLQVFWASRGSNYSEAKSIKINTTKGRNIYTVPLENCLFVNAIRIDLQQGSPETPPKPIVLHSISYHFKYLYKEQYLSNSFKDISLVQGMVLGGTADDGENVIFTDSDPILEFEMKSVPVAYQILFPFFLLILIHFFLSSSLVKGKKNKYYVHIHINCTDNDVIDKVLTFLQEKHFCHRIISFSLSEKESRVTFEVERESISSLYSALAKRSIKDHIVNIHIAADRSGESR